MGIKNSEAAISHKNDAHMGRSLVGPSAWSVYDLTTVNQVVVHYVVTNLAIMVYVLVS